MTRSLVRFVSLALAALALNVSASALEIQTTKVPGRGNPGLCTASPDGLVFNRADRTLTMCAPDGTPRVNTLLNALPSGRRAVETGAADDLTVSGALLSDRLRSVKDNGDVRLSDDLKIGSYLGGSFFAQPSILDMRGAGPPKTINMRSSPPDNGTFFAANGQEISFCPWLGCSPTYDINVTAGWLRTKTTRGIEHAETGLALDQYVTSGFVPAWKPNTSYAVGDTVINTGERYVYRAIVAGRSAASGAGPTVVGEPIGGTNGPTVVDGGVTWQYLQDADYTDAKTTLNVTTFIGENGGHTWSSALNTHLGRGAKTDLAVTQELDFFNDSGADCDKGGKNCFLNLWFVQGPWTSTSFVQAAAGGDSPALAADNSSGGAVLTGINFSGPNTIRNVTFSDGTNAATTLKGYAGTRHVSGFISDESTGPSSYGSRGTYSYAAWSDVSTAPYAVRWDGNYGVAAAKFQDFLVGKWSADPSYAAITFNNKLAVGELSGFFGKAGDTSLYGNVPASGAFRLRVGNSDILAVGGGGLNLTGSITGTGALSMAGSVTSGGDLTASGRIVAPALPTSGAGGGTVCVDANGVFYVKKTSGACL